MPAQSINLNAFKAQIISWFQDDDVSLEGIAQRLTTEFNTPCTINTIKRRLKIWGITKRTRVVETAVLRLKIVTMFFMNFPDATIVCALNQEGCLISLT